MILTTSDEIPGKRITKTIGLVYGNTIRARHLGRDLTAKLKSLIGGELEEYTKMIAESREQAMDRMKQVAETRGANAIVTVRFASTSLMQGAAEILAYGTAVVIE